MAAVILLLVIMLVALLVNRIATPALMATGTSRQYARFQARLAFTGVGFTTSEAEPRNTLVVYGRADAVENLDARRTGTGGELSHIDQVVAHRQRARAESNADDRGASQPDG